MQKTHWTGLVAGALSVLLVPLTNAPALANGEEAPPPPPAAVLPPPPPPSIAGPYVGVMGGANYVESREVEWFAPGGGCGLLCLIDQDVSYDWGWGAGAVVGYRTDLGVRAEIEGMYRENEHDEWHIAGLNIPFDDGDITVISGMVNVLYDIDFGSPVVPYVGVGAGAAYVDVEADLISGNPFDFEDTAWAFAYQGIAGVNFRVNENVDLFADYRYFRTYDLELQDNYLPPPVLKTRSDDEYTAHTVLAGLRFTFTDMALPEMAAAPPPAPAPIPRQFLIFFDWDVDELSAEAQAIVADAAGYVLSGGLAQVVVTGHTDTSGSQSYNVGLSKRRAENTAAALTGHGVDPGTIAVNWKGETEPLIATGDGVREPQNRRAEIVFP